MQRHPEKMFIIMSRELFEESIPLPSNSKGRATSPCSTSTRSSTEAHTDGSVLRLFNTFIKPPLAVEPPLAWPCYCAVPPIVCSTGREGALRVLSSVQRGHTKISTKLHKDAVHDHAVAAKLHKDAARSHAAARSRSFTKSAGTCSRHAVARSATS